MESLTKYIYMGCCCTIFCIALALLMRENVQINMMQDRLIHIVKENVMVEVEE